LRRLAIRWRLTLAFAGALALVISALVLLIYVRVSAELDRAIDGGLRDRASTLSTLAQERDPRRAGQRLRADLAANGEGFAQVIAFDGSVVLDATPSARPLLDRREVARAIIRPLLVDHATAPGSGAGVRLYAVPVNVSGRRYVAVVGTSLRDRERAVQGLTTLLLVSAPVALVLLSLAGYAVVSGALRPVEHMREQAATISAQHTGRRLPVPAGDDELARLGRTLNAMLERLEHALIREREFSANASHELRTPLAMLTTEVELALDRPRTPAEMRGAMISVGEEAERLVRLAEDLLALSRADRGLLPIQPSRTDVADLLIELRNRFRQRVERHGRTIEVDADEPVMLSADPVRLEQAVGNLVENALRHGQGPIELSLQITTDTVELHVRDRGPGFEDGFVEDAFERFSRGDEARARGGSGLGLAIVRAIAEAHDGHAEARNRPQGGADVSISLPLTDTNAHP
jgi:two-component system, OmpR family, sensor kinase